MCCDGALATRIRRPPIRSAERTRLLEFMIGPRLRETEVEQRQEVSKTAERERVRGEAGGRVNALKSFDFHRYVQQRQRLLFWPNIQHVVPKVHFESGIIHCTKMVNYQIQMTPSLLHGTPLNRRIAPHDHLPVALDIIRFRFAAYRGHPVWWETTIAEIYHVFAASTVHAQCPWCMEPIMAWRRNEATWSSYLQKMSEWWIRSRKRLTWPHGFLKNILEKINKSNLRCAYPITHSHNSVEAAEKYRKWHHAMDLRWCNYALCMTFAPIESMLWRSILWRTPTANKKMPSIFVWMRFECTSSLTCNISWSNPWNMSTSRQSGTLKQCATVHSAIHFTYRLSHVPIWCALCQRNIENLGPHLRWEIPFSSFHTRSSSPDTNGTWFSHHIQGCHKFSLLPGGF